MGSVFSSGTGIRVMELHFNNSYLQSRRTVSVTGLESTTKATVKETSSQMHAPREGLVRDIIITLK